MGVEVVIGRQDADLVLADPEVSRRHAVLRPSGHSVLVEDLDSTNGTFVNGEKIRGPITVGPGDQVRIGRTTLEIEPDQRADDTIVSPPLEPDQIRSALVPSAPYPRMDYEDPTHPLPSRTPKSGLQPARPKRKRGWLGAGAFVLAVLSGVIAYVVFVDRRADDDFAARANDACATVQRSGASVDLSRTPTRGELERARNIRLQALGALRALELPEQDVALVNGFLSAFRETNVSITRLERAIGAREREVASVRKSLQANVRDERELAAKAGIAPCGGLAIG